jgi:predicted MFS family arabinose efflux permease
MIPVGSLIIGYISNSLGVRTTVAIQGIICIISVIVYVYYKRHSHEEELETCAIEYKNPKI